MDIPLWELAGILISFLFSAFFSGAETALTSLSDHKTQQLIETMGPWGRRLTLWQKHPTRVITTILLGNNLSNITASVLTADIASRFFEANSIPIAIGVTTFLLLFIGEITPKALSRAYAETLAIPFILLLHLFYYPFYPVIWLMTRLIRNLVHLAGGKLDRQTQVTEEDLFYMLRQGAISGSINKEQENLLSSVMDFSETIAREIMKPRTEMVALSLESPYEKVVELVRESGLSRIPIYDGSVDNIVGIFYSKFLITPPNEEEKKDYLAKRMRPPVFVPESKKINEILKLFQEERIHMAIVVNEFGGTEGLMTLEDVIEEILGEIQDEFDLDEAEKLVKTGDGTWVADARVDLVTLEETLGVWFPEERGYDTLGGFLMEIAGDVPEPGWQHTLAGQTFQVTKSDQKKVIEVRIIPSENSRESASEKTG
ncbi:MAG: hemolysin family protein [Deltaproteobacteria bacterium]|nr:hemolysin family protein [Deltaproteobacteria bacterium]